jgi:hypothetical protein
MIKMSRPFLPDVEDLESVVADYLDSLLPSRRFDDERDAIIRRCIPAFEQLMLLIQSANANGQTEEVLFAAFMRDLALASIAYSTEHPEKSEHITQRFFH